MQAAEESRNEEGPTVICGCTTSKLASAHLRLLYLRLGQTGQ